MDNTAQGHHDLLKYTWHKYIQYVSNVTDGNCVEGCKQRDRCTEEDYGLYADVRYFQLQYLDIPHELKDNFLKQLVEFQKNEIAEYEQKALLVRKSTEEKVS